jgi:hypothetical protein
MENILYFDYLPQAASGSCLLLLRKKPVPLVWQAGNLHGPDSRDKQAVSGG